MWQFMTQNPGLILVAFPLSLVVVYFIARAIFLAYFHTKRDYIRRIFRGHFDQTEGQPDNRKPRP